MKNYAVLFLFLVFGLICGLAGCSASLSRMAAGDATVTLYGADGKEVSHWESDGKVLSEDHSDGWYFTDKATGKVVIVSGGAIVIRPH